MSRLRNLICAYVSDFTVPCVVSFLWVSYYGYTYNASILNSPVINWYAFTLWSLGLMGTLKVYKCLSAKMSSWGTSMLITWLIYFSSLLIIEYFGYNILKIRLVTSESPLILGLIHGRTPLKIFYIIACPLVIFLYALSRVRFNK
jgi:hypothetical protein